MGNKITSRADPYITSFTTFPSKFIWHKFAAHKSRGYYQISRESGVTHFTDNLTVLASLNQLRIGTSAFFKSSRPSPAVISDEQCQKAVVHISRLCLIPVVPTDHWHVCFKSLPVCQFPAKSCSVPPADPHSLHEQSEAPGTVSACDLSWEASVGCVSRRIPCRA